MIPFLLACFVNLAQAGDTRLAGVPTATLANFGLGAADFTMGADSWRAPSPGGWVLHSWDVDEVASRATFAFAVGAVQRQLPPLVVAGADEARGDDGMVIARRGNVVITVREDKAPALAARLLAAEVVEAAALLLAPGHDPASADVERDGFGRRVGR